jgi:integrase
MKYFISCGKTFLELGKFYTASEFCRRIHPRDPGVRTKFKLLFNDAENHFIHVYVLPALQKAFAEKSIQSVHKIYKTLYFSRFFELTMDKLYDHFKSYLHFCAKRLFQSGEDFSYSRLCESAFSTKIQQGNLNKEQRKLLIEISEYWESKYLERNSKIQIKLGQSQWNIPYVDVQRNRTISLDFDGINFSLRNEIQEYLLSWYQKGESGLALARRFYQIKRIAQGFQEITTDCGSFLEINYVNVLQIFDVLQQAKTDQGRQKYALKTIQTGISEARILFDWLKTRNHKETLKNPFRRLKLNNVSSFVESIQYIPDEVIEQLLNVIHECPVFVKRIWLIMMNTGIRVSEALNLKEDCLIYNDKEAKYYLNFLTHKTLKQRRRLGLDDYHSLPIMHHEIIELIRQQIEETKKLREIGSTPYIFLKVESDRVVSPKQVTRYLASQVNQTINSCIKRHQIKDKHGDIWHYSNHQCRKTVAVKLLSNGASLTDVGEILGHLVEKTTSQYYQDIDTMKIAELDKQLFEQLFDTMDEDARNAFTPFEFEQLKKEIMKGSRETPEGHGSCVKHVSFGPCKKSSCVGCSLLLTGPQKLPMWRKLHLEQQSYINNMVNTMKRQGIEDYKNYRDYQAEQHLLALYEDTITKIEKFIQERLPDYEE